MLGEVMRRLLAISRLRSTVQAIVNVVEAGSKIGEKQKE
jgi:hypothetical protein